MAVLQSHTYQYSIAQPDGYWYWSTTLDVSGYSPSYIISKIVTPYGLFRDSIPIPGPVIEAMASSITQLQQQFFPSMLVSPPTLSFTVDEGRGSSPAQILTLTNNGAFGSLLDAGVISSAGYLLLSSSRLPGIPVNGSGSVSVYVDATSLVSGSSPYAASVTFSDSEAVNNPQTVAVAVVVRPKAEISVSVASLTFSVVKPITGPFPVIAAQTFDVSNVGPTGSVLDFQVSRYLSTSPWLQSFVPGTGMLTSGDSATVWVTLAPPEDTCVGTYQETLRVSGYSSNQYEDVHITLVIS